MIDFIDRKIDLYEWIAIRVWQDLNTQNATEENVTEVTLEGYGGGYYLGVIHTGVPGGDRFQTDSFPTFISALLARLPGIQLWEPSGVQAWRNVFDNDVNEYRSNLGNTSGNNNNAPRIIRNAFPNFNNIPRNTNRPPANMTDPISRNIVNRNRALYLKPDVLRGAATSVYNHASLGPWYMRSNTSPMTRQHFNVTNIRRFQ